MQGLENLEGDQILTVSVADDQQGRGGLADTIRQYTNASDGSTLASGKAEDCKSFIPSSNLVPPSFD